MSELTPITMPKWGLMMEEGAVTAWLAGEGERIEAGAELAEIETSKITNVMEAPVSGTLLRIVCEPGRAVPVGQLLAVVGPSDADPATVEELISTHEIVAEDAEDGAGGATTSTVEVNGKTIAYAESGAGDPPIVLIHGFGGDRNNWLFNIDALAADRRVISIDLPGHGASTKALTKGDLAELANDVAGALNQIGVSRAILVGHSLGAGVALQLASAHPEKVAAIAAIAGFGFGGDVSEDFIERFVTAERRKELAGAVEMLFADPGLASREMIDQLLAFKRTDGVQQALEAIAASSLAPGLAAELADKVAGLQVPVLAIHGAADQVIAPPASLPGNVRRETIEGAGHMPHMEAAGAVNALLSSFAAEVG